MTTISKKSDNLASLSMPKAIVLDMDGTFFLGEHLLPGALELLDFLNEIELPFSFLTNNTSKSKQDCVRKLTALGVRQADARIYTAGDATIHYLKKHYPDQKVHLMGTTSLIESFEQAGIVLTEDDPELLVLAYDTELTYRKLVIFCHLLRQGLPYLATHPDLNCPSPNGPLPDIGALMAMIEVSTGRLPDVVLGKPNPGIIQALADEWDLKPKDLLMVGDRLYTDIALGKNAGVKTALVLCGETKLEDLPTSEFQPDLVVDNLMELLEKLIK